MEKGKIIEGAPYASLLDRSKIELQRKSLRLDYKKVSFKFW